MKSSEENCLTSATPRRITAPLGFLRCVRFMTTAVYSRSGRFYLPFADIHTILPFRDDLMVEALMNVKLIPYGKISNTTQLGALLRQTRKKQGISQEDLSALAGIGTRLIGEIERGKATAEVGKVLHLLASLGLEVIVQPRTTRDWQG
jgi:HTH-type transcriptional regulator / antitoxin HipB